MKCAAVLVFLISGGSLLAQYDLPARDLRDRRRTAPVQQRAIGQTPPEALGALGYASTDVKP